MIHRRRTTPRPGRRGAIMLLFVLLVLALLGISAVVIDLGMATLAQAEMQDAADSAAVEGVRLRDHSLPQGFSNLPRRRRVSELVRHTFDDDLHPTLGLFTPPNIQPPDDADAGNFSAGPSITLSGGDATDNIGAIYNTTLDPAIDDPQLQIN